MKKDKSAVINSNN